MERGYLVAALAITLTFAGLSRGYRSLEHISLLHFRHFGAAAGARCNASPAADLAEKMKTRVRSAEEAQLLAESVPIAIQSSIAAQMSRQNAEIGRCARETARRETEQAARQMMRAQRALERERYYVQPMAVQISLPADLSERVQERTARAAARLAASTAAVQVAAARMKFAQRELPLVQWVERTPSPSCRHRAVQAPEPPDPPDAESEN